MDQVNLLARAKINLSLDVLGKRPDGYHEIRSVMQNVTLADSVHVKKVGKVDYLKVVSNIGFLPTDQRNVAYKAAKMLIDKHGISDGVFINLEKEIPVSAGLGGGSADCAAVLIGMHQLFNLNISYPELLKMGLSLGADVPFCLTRGTALAEGVGEKLVRLKPFPKAWFLLIKPSFAVSTAEVFRHYNPDAVQHPDTDKMLYYINKGDLQGICSQMGNVLESVTIARFPLIDRLKKFLLDHGALGALMSGSGPTVFGVFKDRDKAEAAESAAKSAFPTMRDIYVTRAFNVD